MASAERIAQLGQVMLFRGLTEEARVLIAAIAEEEDHPAGHVIFRQGEIGEKLYVIVSGRVRISRDVGGMGEEALAILGPDVPLDPGKINPLGGAIALGHPLGATGAIRTATLVHGLQRTGGKYGMVSMCIGTGMGAAGVFERL